jgi:fatty acid synthase
VDKVFLRNRSSPLLIGSVKSNLGHANAASNFFAIAKVLIAMQTGLIPPNIHYKQPSPNVPALTKNRLKVSKTEHYILLTELQLYKDI